MSRQKREVICGREVHTFASRFPLFGESELAELAASIKQDGLLESIKEDHDGLVCDGRNRLKACAIAGIEPIFETLPAGTDIQRYVIKANVIRRHLSVGQRAMIAADLAPERKPGRPEVGDDSMTASRAAEVTQVSRVSASIASKIKKTGSSDLVNAVRSGAVAISAAKKIAELPVEEQPAAVAAEVVASESKAGTQRSPGRPARATAVTRTSRSDVAFDREKWKNKAEIQLSKLKAMAPVDLQDFAAGVLRELTGGTVRREAKIEIPDGEDAALWDIDEVATAIEQLLSKLPLAERRRVRPQIGQRFIGSEPEHYLPDLSDHDGDHERIKVICDEIKCRQGAVESPAAKTVLRDAQKALRKSVEAE